MSTHLNEAYMYHTASICYDKSYPHWLVMDNLIEIIIPTSNVHTSNNSRIVSMPQAYTIYKSYGCGSGKLKVVIRGFIISHCQMAKWLITRQIWGIWKLRLAYSPETPNLGQNRWCFVPCDLEIWRMTLESDRASLLCCFKLCVTFHSHWWIQTGVTVRKHPIWVKFDDF